MRVKLSAVLFAIGAGIAFGQVDTATISGTVRDSSGAVVPATKVVLLNDDTGVSRTVEADAAGRYSATALGLGSYRVTGTQAGFQTQVRTGIVLTVGREAVVDLVLTVGAVTETVEVKGEAAAIDTTNATISGMVNQDQMRELPLNGRDLSSLALLSPGTFQTTSRNNALTMGLGMRISVDGGRHDANVFLIDGTVVNDHASNGPNSAAGVALGVEGILEFRVLTHNFSAEYGRSSGAVVSQVTRSGTNELHGSVYEFVRNDYFDARNFFNPGALPAFRRNQFGGAAGGPIKKDKIFFFGNYEGLRESQGTTVFATVPDLNARKGLVPNAATGQLQSVLLNPAVVPYLTLFPVPNGRSFGDGTAYNISNFTVPTTENYAMGRVDVRLSDKDNLFGRYIFDQSGSTQPRPIDEFVSQLKGKNNFIVLSETHVFSGASVNDFHTSFNRTAPGGGDHAVIPIDPALSFVPGQPFGKIQFQFNATASSQGLSTLGPMYAPSGPDEQKFFQNIYEQGDTFSTNRGAHALKFGAHFERVQLNQGSFSGYGAYTFGGLLPLLAGTDVNFQATLPGGVTERGYRRENFAWFVQDDYRLRPNLTINLGLRDEFFTSPTEVGGRIGQLINLTDPKETAGVSYKSRLHNFSPRIGIAWDPFGKGKTSIRAGAGIYYNLIDGRTYYIEINGNSLFTTSTTISNAPFPHGLSGGIPLGSSSPSSMSYTPDEPTVIQYNLDVQQQLTRSISLRVGYVGSDGYHMAHLTQPNVRIPQVCPCAAAPTLPAGTIYFPATGPAVNPNFAAGSMMKVLFDSRYNYNGLQMALQKALSSGLTLQASYTWSKAMSDGDQITNTAITSSAASQLNIFNRAQDYSLSSFDQRETLVLNGSYRIPLEQRLQNQIAKTVLGGWTMIGIYSYGSGLPMNIQTGYDASRNLDTLLTDRPNLAPGFSNNPIHGVTAGCQGVAAGEKLQTATVWFDPCAFSLQTVGTFGNLGRNTVTTPGTNNVDFTLEKTTAIRERIRLVFRAEFFNILNHTQFGLPGRTIFDSTGNRTGNDGAIGVTAVDNREMQFGLKLVF